MVEIITAKQLAEETHIHIDTIRKYARSGDIPGVKYKGQWRFDGDRINKMIRNREQIRPLYYVQEEDYSNSADINKG